MSARRHTLAAAVVALVVAGPATAQVPQASDSVVQLLNAARADIDGFGFDTAFARIQRVLAPAAGATLRQRVRGLTLLGIVELSRENRTAARQALVEALRGDPMLRIDSLTSLHSDLLVVFAEARAELGVSAPATSPFTVRLTVPADTTFPGANGALPIGASPTMRSRVVVSVSPAEAPQAVVWSNEWAPGDTGTATWNLRGRDGQPSRDGRYALRAVATDAEGQVSPTIERILVVTRTAPDTSHLPTPPPASAFRPETVAVHPGSPRNILVGVAFGVGAALLPMMHTTEDLSVRTGAMATAVTVMAIGAIGFLAGHHRTPSSENAQFNRGLRDSFAREHAAALARATASAAVRVQLESSP